MQEVQQEELNGRGRRQEDVQCMRPRRQEHRGWKWQGERWDGSPEEGRVPREAMVSVLGNLEDRAPFSPRGSWRTVG